jgi:transposase
MTETDAELLKGLIVGRKSDGRNYYDVEAKRKLIEWAMRPGVSVARVALQHGVNANLLRTWIRKYQQREVGVGREAVAVRPAFVAVVPTLPPSQTELPRLIARLPNGVRLELESVGRDDLAAILRQLCALPCSDSTAG